MKISQKCLLFQKIRLIHNNEFSRCQALATKVPGMRTPIGSMKILPQRVILMLTSLLTTPTGRSSKPPSGSRELSKSQQFSRKRVKISNQPGTEEGSDETIGQVKDYATPTGSHRHELHILNSMEMIL